MTYQGISTYTNRTSAINRSENKNYNNHTPCQKIGSNIAVEFLPECRQSFSIICNISFSSHFLFLFSTAFFLPRFFELFFSSPNFPDFKYFPHQFFLISSQCIFEPSEFSCSIVVTNL